MIIGLVGRTNVGKSTLFNRLLGTYRAIVTDIAGTTRELLREEVTLKGLPIVLMDSPGLENFKDEEPFIERIIEEADLLLFVVDGKQDIGEHEHIIADMIRSAGKKSQTLMIVNKLDGKVYHPDVDMLMAEYYALGFDRLVPVSAAQQEGMGSLGEILADEIIQHNRSITKEKQTKKKQDPGKNHLSLAILGRPNVGKSTLLNTLSGDELAWVQDLPGTTLDYITAEVTYKNRTITLYDTAGIRKKGKIVGLERIAYAKTVKMLSWVKPVVVVLIDGEEGLTHRDKSLLGELDAAGLPMIIAVNKIDLFTPEGGDTALKELRDRVGFARVPVIKISGKDGLGLPKLLDEVATIATGFHQRVPTPELNKLLKEAWVTKPPRFPKNKICKRKYISQVDTAPPKFLLSVNNAAYANFSFKRWVENVIRKKYGFSGVPIRLAFSSKVKENPYLQVNKDSNNKKRSQSRGEKSEAFDDE